MTVLSEGGSCSPGSTYSGPTFFAILLSVINSFGGEDENTPVLLLKNAQEEREQAHCGSDFHISFLHVDDEFEDIVMGYVS